MLEIILLILLSKKIKETAIQKGEKPSRWIIMAISAWLTGELLGVLIILGFIGNAHLMISMIFGMGMGYLFFLFVKQALENKPDMEEY